MPEGTSLRMTRHIVEVDGVAEVLWVEADGPTGLPTLRVAFEGDEGPHDWRTVAHLDRRYPGKAVMVYGSQQVLLGTSLEDVLPAIARRARTTYDRTRRARAWSFLPEMGA